ncbi:MAG: hypothetical protein WBE48_23665 [Xanthobacteraceae bacterium]
MMRFAAAFWLAGARAAILLAGVLARIFAATEKPGVAAICTRAGMTASGGRFAPVVRINDRGLFNKQRIIDVSPAAAKQLQFSGLTLVTLDVVPAKQ